MNSEISFPRKERSLLSPRTASYVDALIRAGDNFDYSRWLENARAVGAQASRVAGVTKEPGGSSGLHSVASDCLLKSPVAKPAFVENAGPVPRAVWRSRYVSRQEALESRPKRRLRRVWAAWNDFQSSRTRDAVYKYLAGVLAIVQQYKVRRKTRKLLRHAFEFADLPFDRSADPFTAIIRCTSETVDSKTISKWARALRYVARCKPPETTVKAFMKDLGGVNACADLYTKHFGQARRG